MDKMVTIKVRSEMPNRRYLTDPTEISVYRKKVLKRMAGNAGKAASKYIQIGILLCALFGIIFGSLAVGMAGLEYIIAHAFVNL